MKRDFFLGKAKNTRLKVPKREQQPMEPHILQVPGQSGSVVELDMLDPALKDFDLKIRIIFWVGKHWVHWIFY